MSHSSKQGFQVLEAAFRPPAACGIGQGVARSPGEQRLRRLGEHAVDRFCFPARMGGLVAPTQSKRRPARAAKPSLSSTSRETPVGGGVLFRQGQGAVVLHVHQGQGQGGVVPFSGRRPRAPSRSPGPAPPRAGGAGPPAASSRALVQLALGEHPRVGFKAQGVPHEKAPCRPPGGKRWWGPRCQYWSLRLPPPGSRPDPKGADFLLRSSSRQVAPGSRAGSRVERSRRSAG